MISVIIPIYKVEKYIKKCIDSILNQTYTNLEIILVDDGSPDNCPSICDEYAKKDKRIKVIHQENAGLSASRNAGIKIAKGEYIGFVDSDDYIAPEMYKKLLELITREEADLAICNVQKVDEEGEVLTVEDVDEHIYDRESAFERLNIKNSVYYVTAWNKLYKRELFESILFPVGKIHEDEFIVHQIFDKCNRIVSTEKCYYYYTQRFDSIMSTQVSVKRLDAIEAFCDRCEFYSKNETLQQYTVNAARTTWRIYMNICRGVSKTDPEVKKSLHKARKQIKKAYGMVPKKELAWKDWLKYISPNIAVWIYTSGIVGKVKKILKFVKNAVCFSKNVDVILLDTPEHGNLGDQAIVLAEEQVLKDRGIKYTEVTAGELNNLEKWYSKLTPMNRYIVIPGGGFLGALWPVEEYRFRRILMAFKNHRIIVFPQTITFDMKSQEGIAFFEESKQVYTSHKNLTICVREKMSLDFMQTYMPEVDVILVPDIVTLLKSNTAKYDRKDILMCMRSDKEKALSSKDKSSIQEILEVNYPKENIVFTDTVIPRSIKSADRTSEVQKKLDEFAKSRLVITDRLHGMIFAAITGTPCIAFGNSNGKVKAVYEWIKELPYIYFVNSVSEMNEAIEKIDIHKQYIYNRELINDEFEKLYELLLRKDM